MNNSTNMTVTGTFPRFKGAAFLRVSTDKQDVARQKHEILYVAKRNNIEIVKWIVLNGVSGKDTLTDAQVKKVLKEMEQPGLDGLITPSVDRVYRPTELEHYSIGSVFRKFNKWLWTNTDGNIAMWTDEGRDQFVEAGVRAAKELAKIRQRSMSGKWQNLRDEERIAECGGFTPVNSPAHPYGFTHVFHDRNTGVRAHWIINETEAQWVRQIFTWLLQGLKCHEIAARLNKEGVPSQRAGRPLRKGRPATEDSPAIIERLNDGKWREQTVRQLITREHYCGEYTSKPGTDEECRCTCPMIIERDVWAAAQLKLAENEHNPTAPRKDAKHNAQTRLFQLTGMGWCKFCGFRLTSKTRPFPKGYYVCSNCSKPPVRSLCPGPLPHIDKDTLEACVFERTWTGVTEGDTLVDIVNEQFAQAPADPLALAEAEKTREQIADLKLDLDRAHKNCRDRRYNHDLAMDEYAEVERNLKLAECRLSAALAVTVPRKGARPTDAAIRAKAARLASVKPETPQDRRIWMQAIIENFITDGNIVEITCAVPAQDFIDLTGIGETDTLGEQKESNSLIGCQYSALATCSPSLRPSGKPLSKPISFTFTASLR